MQTLWRLAARNWWVNPARTAASILSIALGVGLVVTITNFYETARYTLTNQVIPRWLGTAHISVHPVGAHRGTLDATLTNNVKAIEGVSCVSARLVRRMNLYADLPGPIKLADRKSWDVDAIGIDAETAEPFLILPNLEGKPIEPEQSGVAVIEREMLDVWRTALGRRIMLANGTDAEATPFTIIGVYESQRNAQFQHPPVYIPIGDLRRMRSEPNAATTINIRLDDPTPDKMNKVKDKIEKILTVHSPLAPCRVDTKAEQQGLLNEAERVTRLVLVLISFVAMLTSFFIILTTVSMNLFERRRVLGTMRCVGATRLQLTQLLFLETLPLGIAGTALGLCAGLLLTAAVSRLVGEFGAPNTEMQVSNWGIALASISGFLTTFLATAALVFQINRITPLCATKPHAVPARSRNLYVCGVIGIVLLAIHQVMLVVPDPSVWLNGPFATAGVVTLYGGYALVVPAVVRLVGRPLAHIVGVALGVPAKLAADQIGHAPWRATGICWVLMVGLSLIIYLAARSQSVLAIWDFPAKLPEAFVWSPQYVRGEVIEQVKGLPGVGELTVSTDLDCTVEPLNGKKRSLKETILDKLFSKVTRPVFVAGIPDELMNIAKIVYLEGNAQDAKEKLASGGYVLIPLQTAQNRDLHLGDRVAITARGRTAEFEIAGVIHSPAMDMAITSFQAQTYMQFAAALAMLGTRQDMEEKFGFDGVSMFMFNVDAPSLHPPPDFDPNDLPNTSKSRQVARTMLGWRSYLPTEKDTFEKIAPALEPWLARDDQTLPPQIAAQSLRRFARALDWIQYTSQTKRYSVEENWRELTSRLVLLRVAQEMGRPNAVMGSLTRLKQAVDRSLRQALSVLTWLPSIILVVAALGIGNLMMVSVKIRERSLAMLRAVGTLRSQIIRLVLSEAITLGLIGSAVGLALGIHQTLSINRLIVDLLNVSLDFIFPTGAVVVGTLLTVTVCLVAGIKPARYAARENVIEAMQGT